MSNEETDTVTVSGRFTPETIALLDDEIPDATSRAEGLCHACTVFRMVSEADISFVLSERP